jgi:DNA-binding NtrC family response regulator
MEKNASTIKEEPPQHASRKFRIVESVERSSVQRLIDLTLSLLREAQTLAGDKALADESQRLQALNFSEGIDFMAEVKEFEASLIKLALARTGGDRVRAAKLLNIDPTILKSKTALYGMNEDAVLEARTQMAALFQKTRNFGVGVRPSREEMHERGNIC